MKILCALFVALLGIAAVEGSVSVSYPSHFRTSSGNDITDILIIESDGVNPAVLTAFPTPLDGKALGPPTDTITHTSVLNSVTNAVIIGRTFDEKSGKQEICLWMDKSFAHSIHGKKWSDVYRPNDDSGNRIGHDATQLLVQAAHGGDAAAQTFFKDLFFDSAKANVANNGIDTQMHAPFTLANVRMVEFSIAIAGAEVTFSERTTQNGAMNTITVEWKEYSDYYVLCDQDYSFGGLKIAYLAFDLPANTIVPLDTRSAPFVDYAEWDGDFLWVYFVAPSDYKSANPGWCPSPDTFAPIVPTGTYSFSFDFRNPSCKASGPIDPIAIIVYEKCCGGNVYYGGTLYDLSEATVGRGESCCTCENGTPATTCYNAPAPGDTCSDCDSFFFLFNQECIRAACDDGRKNGDEVTTDRGGSCPNKYKIVARGEPKNLDTLV